MRVRLRPFGPLTANDACLTNIAGETEDYMLNIIPAKVAVIFSPSFADTLYTQVISLTAQIKQSDIGLNSTDSLKPRMWVKSFEKNNWKPVKGTLKSGTVTNGFWEFSINHDSLNIRRNGCDSIQFYFVAQDLNSPSNIGYLPEPGPSHLNVQTQILPAPIPFGYRLKPRLRDTIYVSGNNCRYQSLSGENGLFQHLNSGQLETDLTVIIDGDVSETGKYALTEIGLNGHRLTIRPDGNTVRTLTGYYSNTSAIQLDGVKNILIDGSFNGAGRYLRFQNSSSAYLNNNDTASNIKIFNSCDSIKLTNLIFEYKPYSHSIGEASVLLTYGTNNNIFITNNLFKEATTSVLPEKQIVSVKGNNKAIIIENEFKNFSQSGILISTPCNNWIIENNHFYRSIIPGEYTYNVAAISITGGGHIISGNYIGGQLPFCAGSAMSFVNNPASEIAGIKSAGSSGDIPNIISFNRIDNISVTNTVSASANVFVGITSANNYSIIKNNIIGNPSAATSSINIVANSIYGISVTGTQDVEILNNSISSLATKGTNGYMQMYGIYKANFANGLAAYNAVTLIRNNKIYNLSNTLNGTSVNSNVFSDLGGTAGIKVENGLTNVVEKNEIFNISVTINHVSGIIAKGIYGSKPSIIQRNRIYNISNSSNAVGACCGDDMYNGIINGIGIDGENTGIDILNNQITLMNNNLVNPVSIRGIYEAYGNTTTTTPQQRILYNTVYIGGTANQNGGSAAYFSLYTKVKNISNNIFYNERTGGTKGHFIYRFPIDASFIFAYSKADNNLYIVPDTLLFAQTNDAVYSNWSKWKSISKSDNASYIPLIKDIPASQLFIDKLTGNLNIDTTNETCWYANNKATPFPEITADFDSSNIRITDVNIGNTDIGSDEFSTSIPAPGSICEGTNITLTSNIVGLTYQWQQKISNSYVNLNDNANYSGTQNAAMQINNVPYQWNGQQYRCMVNGNLVSSVFAIAVNQKLTPSVTISTGNTAICSGASITFTAVPVNGGPSPDYQWKRNGINTGTNNAVFISNTLVSGDVITVQLTSKLTCVNSATATSNSITVTVTPSANAGITISGNTSVKLGTATRITSAVTNGGTGPAFQWQDSTSSHSWLNLKDSTASSINYLPLFSGNKLRCILNGNATCSNAVNVISNVLEFSVDSLRAGGRIMFFPNPVTNMLIIDNLNQNMGWQNLSVININGTQNILVYTITGQSKAVINVAGLSSGIYIAVLRNNKGETSSFKFFKK